MNPATEQILKIYKNVSLPKKILAAALILTLLAAFIFIFYWANKPVYRSIMTHISPEDSAQIVDKLDQWQVPYILKANGTIIEVPEERVNKVLIDLAGAGLPKGGKVGYELFDEEKFGTTEFSRHLNYQRALQGELARTIAEIEQVDNAKVMIVPAKDSVFMEEEKPATASVLLKLNTHLSKSRIKAIVHLVASAVEGLAPEHVTVIDTEGNVLSEGSDKDDSAETLANTQLAYKLALEKNYTERIQSMLEKIVGHGKAIVRVTADLDFNQMDQSEELYDPDTQVARSQNSISESGAKQTTPISNISSVNPIATNANSPLKSTEKNQKKNEIINYEINKTVRRTIKPMATLQRLSVAAVLDGNYVNETNDQGQLVAKYVERPPAELAKYAKIVRQAMGYSADREDQVTVESFPFTSFKELNTLPKPTWLDLLNKYRGFVLNAVVIILIFAFLVFPVMRAMKEIKATVIESALPPPDESQGLLTDEAQEALPEPEDMTPKQKAIYLANEDIEKTTNIIRSWMAEAEA